MHIKVGRGRRVRGKKIKEENGKMYPSEMRLLLVTRQIKKKERKEKPGGEGKIIIIAVKMWKATHKAQKGGKWKETLEAFVLFCTKKERMGDFMSTRLLVVPLLGSHWDGTNFMIITLILLCCSLVWCKELFFLSRLGKEGREKSIIFIDSV